MKKTISLIFGIYLLTFSALAEENFSYAQLEDLIKSSQVHSIDELLPLLPLDFRKSYSLMYESRSLQGGDTYPEYPRVILSSNNGRLIITFTKGPDMGPAQIGSDNIESVEFDDNTKSFVFREIAFGPNLDPMNPPPEKNPKICLACHGTSPRPNWQVYNMWPGAYGSMSRLGCDTMKVNSSEWQNYKKYLSQSSRQGRYAFLAQPISTGKCPDGTTDELTFTNGKTTEPNALLNDVFNKLNFLHLSDIIKNSASYANFKYMIKGLGKAECESVGIEGYFPDGYAARNGFLNYGQWWEKIVAAQRILFADSLKTFNLNNSASTDNLSHRPVNFLDPADDDGFSDWITTLPYAVTMRVLADRMNLDMRHWSTDFGKSESYGFTGSTTGPNQFFSSIEGDPEIDSLDCFQLLCKSRNAFGDSPDFCKKDVLHK